MEQPAASFFNLRFDLIKYILRLRIMDAFAALADETRREIVRMVAKNGRLTSTRISQNFKMSPPAISQHLKVLREAKVLQMEKEAQMRIYSLNESGMLEVEDWLEDIRNLWSKRLDRLDQYVQKIKKERSRDQK